MKNIKTTFIYLIILVTLLFINTLVVFAIEIKKDEYEKSNKIAIEFIEKFTSENYTDSYIYFDEKIKSLVTLEQLKQTYIELKGAFGNFLNIVSVGNTKTDNLKISEIVLKFEKSLLNARIVIDTNYKVAGMFFIPTYERKSNNLVSYIDTTRFVENEIEFGNKDFLIKGSLCIPNYLKTLNAVIMLSGSGPNNRDSEIGPNSPFKDIAHGLATKGIISLRFDKRTKLYGKKIFTNNLELTLNEEYYEDTDFAIEYLLNYCKLNKIKIKNLILLGHSQGGTVIPYLKINSKFKDNIDASILMATPARNLEDIVKEQFKYIFSLDNILDTNEQKQLDNLDIQISNLKNNKNEDLPLGLSKDYFNSLENNNFIVNLEKLNLPLIILSSGKDYQVTPIELNIIENALKNNKNVNYKFYDELNHIFIKVDGVPSPSQYNTPGNVDSQVINDLIKWISLLNK